MNELKQRNISFKNKKKVRKPKDEWYRVENTHEAKYANSEVNTIRRI